MNLSKYPMLTRVLAAPAKKAPAKTPAKKPATKKAAKPAAPEKAPEPEKSIEDLIRARDEQGLIVAAQKTTPEALAKMAKEMHNDWLAGFIARNLKVDNNLAISLLDFSSFCNEMKKVFAKESAPYFYCYVHDSDWGKYGAEHCHTVTRTKEEAQFKMAKFCIEYGQDRCFVDKRDQGSGTLFYSFSTLVMHRCVEKLYFRFNRNDNTVEIRD